MSDESTRPHSNQAGNQSGDEDVRQLLAAAGHRPDLPAEDLAAVKALARAEWHRLVRGERQRRRRSWAAGALALAAAVLLVLMVGLWWRASRSPVVPDNIASVELLAGEVRLEVPAGAVAGTGLAPGAELPVGAALDTLPGDQTTHLALRMAGGESVRLAADSRIRLSSDLLLELERGAVYIDTGKRAHVGAAVEIVTPLGLVRHIGTQYEVRLIDGQDTALRLRVREGAVHLTRAEEVFQAVRGEELTLRGDGELVRGSVETHGEEWAWVVAAAPSPTIEGQTLRSYLDWLARETGWSISFADPVLERSASTVILYGTIEGLTPEESLSVVLPGSGLAWHLDSGTLLIVESATDAAGDVSAVEN